MHIYNISFKNFSIVDFRFEEHSTKGSLGVPKSYSMQLIAYLIGMGLVSANKALIRGKAFNCSLREVAILFSKNEFVILQVS